jgi:hypothetical protein
MVGGGGSDDALFSRFTPFGPSFLLVNQRECSQFSIQGLVLIAPDPHAARGGCSDRRKRGEKGAAKKN